MAAVNDQRGLCRTPTEAFLAGYGAPCPHGLTPVDCADCRLSITEIGRLAVLLRSAAAPPLKEVA
ncbi:hypothetical protein [Streptomyces sp. CAU 1734]|uniref:hypothetical protein n=1 Tax=Streptomyces sp. CAU 1734 TaxID=3140360 RepID=UPI003261CC3D